ncbi:hypothetical protein SLOPH_1187, partial [Spraguea lophii 42_110]
IIECKWLFDSEDLDDYYKEYDDEIFKQQFKHNKNDKKIEKNENKVDRNENKKVDQKVEKKEKKENKKELIKHDNKKENKKQLIENNKINKHDNKINKQDKKVNKIKEYAESDDIPIKKEKKVKNTIIPTFLKNPLLYKIIGIIIISIIVIYIIILLFKIFRNTRQREDDDVYRRLRIPEIDQKRMDAEQIRYSMRYEDE